jgi:hypothetical protein
MYSCQFPVKSHRKRKSLTVQGDFYKIIDVGRTELCFLSILMGNVRLAYIIAVPAQAGIYTLSAIVSADSFCERILRWRNF